MSDTEENGSPDETSEKKVPEVIQRLLADHPDVPRQSWAGSVDPSIPSNPSLASKFGGELPFMPADKAWPVCEECNDKKTFVCQINIRQIPKEMQSHIGLSSGLFQMFFCFECSPFQNVFDDVNIVPEKDLSVPQLKLLAGAAAGSTNVVAKNIPGSLKKFINEIKDGVKENPEYPQRFVKWDVCPYMEIMNSEELQTLEQFGEDEYDELDEFYDEPGQIQGPSGDIKLGGYVAWVQSPEYPDCPDCKVSMKTTFLQLSQCDLFFNSWGDCGVAHVTLCPACNKPGLGWACC